MIKITRNDLLIAQKGLCFYCGLPMDDFGQTETSCTQDHFYPRHNGGKKHNNIVLAHAKCNREKSDRFPTELENVRFDVLYRNVRATKKVIESLRESWGRARPHKKRLKYDKRHWGVR